MIKYLRFLLIGSAMLLAGGACYKDHSNYSYQQPEVITVTGIENAYTRIAYQDNLSIDPTVSSSATDTLFDCYWGVHMASSISLFSIKMDTLAHTRQLNYRVALPAGQWKLVFCARNRKTGYSQYTTSDLAVATEFTRGWYVVKNNGAQTDLDLFLTPQSITPDGKMENIIQQVNNRQLEGKASSLMFTANYKTDLSNSGVTTRAIAVWSDKDLVILDLNSCQILRTFESLFFDPPAIKAPGAFFFQNSSYYLLNNGKVHSIYNISKNTGQFGNAHVNGTFNDDYRLSRYYCAYGPGGNVFFDEISSSFMLTTGNGQQLTKYPNNPASNMPSISNNKTMLYMGLKATSPYTGYAILQDKSNSSLKLLTAVKVTGGFSPVLTLTADTIAPASKMHSASLFTTLNGDESLLYFLRGNEIWSRNLSNKAEQLQYTVPAGETISFIRHRKYTGTVTTEQPYYFNYIIVGSSSGENYKIRMFTKTAGNMAATPAFVLEGKGRAADITYISPNVADATFFTTY